jgi:hypothetical protein
MYLPSKSITVNEYTLEFSSHLGNKDSIQFQGFSNHESIKIYM